MVQTRKSNRVIIPTTKAKQYQETSKKPILRSISTIDEDENTYNNLNFKKRKICLNNNKAEKTHPESGIEEKIEEKHIDEITKPKFVFDQENEFEEEFEHLNEEEQANKFEEDELFGHSDNEDIFNSDEDEYYSAISDYETEPISYYSKSFLQKKFGNGSHIMSENSLNLNEKLFDHDEESVSEVNSPINSSFNFNNNFNELKSLEENLQKIIDENKKLHQSKSIESTESLSFQKIDQNSSNNTISDIFVDYLSDDVSSSDESEFQHASSSKKPKFLQYRHDEKHNLAFPDVSTFPIRFDPLLAEKSVKSKMVRALKRRAIQTGQASEMVGTGITLGEFNFF